MATSAAREWRHPVKLLLLLPYCLVCLLGVEILPSHLMDGAVNETDGDFTLMCGLLDSYYSDRNVSRNEINSSSMYWVYKSEVLEGTYVINNRMVGIKIENITTSMSGKYHCVMNETATSGKEYAALITTEITIGNPPEPVTSIDCVSQNWLDMTCSWCPSDSVDPLTKYELWYQIDASGEWRQCPSENIDPTLNCTCFFGQSFMHPSMYEMQVVTIDGYLRNVSSEVFMINTTFAIVQPGPVQDLMTTAVNSTSIHVSWKPHKDMISIDNYGEAIYVVYYSSQWGDQEETLNVDINKSVTLHNLRPHTEYDIGVRSKTKESVNKELYWSESVNKTEITDISNPAVGPPMHSTSYKWRDCPKISSNTGILQLFWQEISPIDQNGVIQYYRIKLTDTKSNNTFDWYASGEDYSHSNSQNCLDKTRPYTVQIEALTADDLPSPPTVVHIESSLQMPKNIYAEEDMDNMTVRFVFQYKGLADNFTLLKCQPDKFDSSQCKTPPTVDKLSGDVRNYTAANYHFLDVFALGVSTGVLSSGLTKDWIPLCKKDRPPGRPVIRSLEAVSERSLTVKWDRIQCSSSEQLGVPESYKLHWTDGTDEDSLVFYQSLEHYEHIIESLKPATSYNISVVAKSSAGFGQNDSQSAATKYSVPGDPPQNVEIVDIGADFLTVHCDPPMLPNGHIHTYYIHILGGSKENLTESCSPSELHEGFNITDLDGYTNYTISLQADNTRNGEGGLSDRSQPLTAETLIGYPTQVENLRASYVNKTTVLLMWDPPFPSNGPIDHMTYRITSQLGEKIYQKDTHQTKVELVFMEDCGSEAETVQSWVTALMQNGEQSLEGSRSGPVDETICSVPNPLRTVGIAVGCATFVLLVAAVFGFLVCYSRKKHEEADGKSRINTEKLFKDNLNLSGDELGPSDPLLDTGQVNLPLPEADEDSAAGDLEQIDYSSSSSSDTSKRSGDSMLHASIMTSGSSVPPGVTPNSLPEIEPGMNTSGALLNDSNVLPKLRLNMNNNKTSLDVLPTPGIETSSVQVINSDGGNFSSSNEYKKATCVVPRLDSNVSVMSNAFLTSDNSAPTGSKTDREVSSQSDQMVMGSTRQKSGDTERTNSSIHPYTKITVVKQADNSSSNSEDYSSKDTCEAGLLSEVNNTPPQSILVAIPSRLQPETGTLFAPAIEHFPETSGDLSSVSSGSVTHNDLMNSEGFSSSFNTEDSSGGQYQAVHTLQSSVPSQSEEEHCQVSPMTIRPTSNHGLSIDPKIFLIRQSPDRDPSASTETSM